MNIHILSLRVLRVRIVHPGAFLWWSHHGRYREASVAACQEDQGADGFLAEREVTESSGWGGDGGEPGNPTSEPRSTGDSDCLGVLLNAALGVQVPAAAAANSGEKYEKTLVLDSHFLQWRHPGDRALIHHPVVVLTGLYSSLFSFLDQAICSVSKFPSYLAIGGIVVTIFPNSNACSPFKPQLHVQIYCFRSDRIAKVIVWNTQHPW